MKSGGVAKSIGDINHDVNGDFIIDITWTQGYVNYQGTIVSSSQSQFSQPFLLKAGERVTVGTENNNVTIIGKTNEDSLSVGDTVTPLVHTSPTLRYETHSYTATEDTKIVVCVLASNYTLEFYNTNNFKQKLDNIDAVPTEGSEDLVESGGVYDQIVSSVGAFEIEKALITSSSPQVIYQKSNVNYGDRIALRLKSRSCDIADGKYITASLYTNNGNTKYVMMRTVGLLQTVTCDAGDYIRGIYVVAPENSIESAGNVEIEVLFGVSYDVQIVDDVPVEDSKFFVRSGGVFSSIEKTDVKTDISGREVLSSTLVAQQGAQVIGTVRGLFGRRVAMRVLLNKATLASGTNINVTFYNHGSAFYNSTITSDWNCFDFRSQKDVEAIYITTSGEVSVAGNISVEIAYNEYYPTVKYQSAIQQGAIELPNLNSNISKMFSKPIRFDDVSDMRIEIKNFTTAGIDHPFVHVYGIYGSNGSVKRPLQPIIEDGQIITIASYGFQYLYGIYYWNEQNDAKSFEATVYINMLEDSIPSIKSYDYSMSMPLYYNSYIEDRIKLLRTAIKSSIINGDVFYFITDTHWEYNAKHSPAIIKELNKVLNIPRLLHGGDMYHFGLNNDKYNVECLNLLRDSMNSNKVYETDGNHEYLFNIATYGDVFAETRMHLDDVVFGGANKNYYYFDNKQKKIRYISLCAYGENQANFLVNQEQQEWLSNVAFAVETGWCIIIFTHIICGCDPSRNYTIFDYSGATTIMSIIDNYQGNGKIIGLLQGHTHVDYIAQSRCTCPIIDVTCDTNYPFRNVIGGQDYYDLADLLTPRKSGTINEQAFDVVIFDKDDMLFHCVRIGSNALNRNDNFGGNAQVDVRTVYINHINLNSAFVLHPFYESTSWESSDNNIVSVSNGDCVANSTGCAVITATAQSGFKQSFFIRVVNP